MNPSLFSSLSLVTASLFKDDISDIYGKASGNRDILGFKNCSFSMNNQQEAGSDTACQHHIMGHMNNNDEK